MTGSCRGPWQTGSRADGTGRATRGSRGSAVPALASSARVDVDVRRGIPATGVHTKSADEVRVLLFDALHREHHQYFVGHRDAAVAIGIYSDVGGVTVLVAAVARRAR